MAAKDGAEKPPPTDLIAGSVALEDFTLDAMGLIAEARSHAHNNHKNFIDISDLLSAAQKASKGADGEAQPLTDNARAVIDKARSRAKEKDHQAIGTEDLLWAMFNAPQIEGRAVSHMMQQGIPKEGVWGVHQYTPNVHTVLGLAQELAERKNETTIGTEDLLWAIFHNPSMNSRALEFLSSKGITKGSVWGEHRFSENVNKVLRDARQAAETNEDLVIGTEDLLQGMARSLLSPFSPSPPRH
jgi:ATP-dependent Clp protease ATP-binding subunit ClpA